MKFSITFAGESITTISSRKKMKFTQPFKNHFELQDHNPDVIAETVQSFVSVSDLSNVSIEWEGLLDEVV
jgi:hypothetical protein